MGLPNGWKQTEVDPVWVETISRECSLHPIAARVLATRKLRRIQDIYDFLYPKLAQLHDPYLLEGMERAVERIFQALKRQERIFVCGDNDVDGMSATALLVECLQDIGLPVWFGCPDWDAWKKDLLTEVGEKAKAHQCTLIILADCGTSERSEGFRALRDQGIDVIVVDHHAVLGEAPECCAFLNPKESDRYPNRQLTAVGVAFKFAHALLEALVARGFRSLASIDLHRSLDLVALGTVADMGSLRGENRILVFHGFAQMRRLERCGIAALCQICRVNPEHLTALQISTKLAPRLNSLGRMTNADRGIELLLTNQEDVAQKIVVEIESFNIERQKIERESVEKLKKHFRQHPHIPGAGIFLVSADWHPGIIPILCARLARQYQCPTVLIALQNGVGKGSMRTVPSFPLLPYLRDNRDLFVSFGGHEFAAGGLIVEKKIPEFKKRFEESMKHPSLQNLGIPEVRIDAEVNFGDLTQDLLESLALLEPIGIDNPPPLFYCLAQQMRPPKIAGQDGWKFFLTQGECALEGIMYESFSEQQKRLASLASSLHVAYTPLLHLRKSHIHLQIRDVQGN